MQGLNLCRFSLPLIIIGQLKRRGTSISRIIDQSTKFDGNARDCLKAMVQSVTEPWVFWATALKNAMHGEGTWENHIIRVFVTQGMYREKIDKYWNRKIAEKHKLQWWIADELIGDGYVAPYFCFLVSDS